tara:strand:+ start:752 stop:916 length:165 start_codon:yes stop_codon:yes gene_type:complete
MKNKKENQLSRIRKNMKRVLTDPSLANVLPDNPDQVLDKKKILYGDYIKKAKIL